MWYLGKSIRRRELRRREQPPPRRQMRSRSMEGMGRGAAGGPLRLLKGSGLMLGEMGATAGFEQWICLVAF